MVNGKVTMLLAWLGLAWLGLAWLGLAWRNSAVSHCEKSEFHKYFKNHITKGMA